MRAWHHDISIYPRSIGSIPRIVAVSVRRSTNPCPIPMTFPHYSGRSNRAQDATKQSKRFRKLPGSTGR